MITVSTEFELADRIVQGVSGGGRVTVTADAETVHCVIARRPGWKLVNVAFSREALQRLESDPLREVKIEYLQRDIARVARSRRDYRYPRAIDDSRRDADDRAEYHPSACAM